MAKRIGVFADVSNLYYCLNKKFPSRKLDYRKYISFIKDLGDISVCIAYGAQMSGQAMGFIYCLKQVGFTTKFKAPKVYNNQDDITKRKADWDVGIAMDIVTTIDRLDMIFLGSADGDMTPVVDWAKSKGVEVVVMASGISKDLRDHATKFIEIPESLLEAIKPAGAKNREEMIDQHIQEGKINPDEN